MIVHYYTARRLRIKQQIADADRRLEHMQTAAAAADAQVTGATAELQAARTALTTATAEEQEVAALAQQPSGDVRALLERRAAARRTELKRLDKQLTAANEALGELADALHEATERQLSAQQALADADSATAGDAEPGSDTASGSAAAAAESEQEAAARRQALITAREAAVAQCEQQYSAAVQAVEQGDAERVSSRTAVAALQKQQRELARQAASCTAAAREASAALAAAQSRAKQAAATAAASAAATTDHDDVGGVDDDKLCDHSSDGSDARTRVEQLRAAMLDLEAAHTEAKKELKALGRKASTLGPGVDETQVRLRVAHVETLKQQLTTVRSVSLTTLLHCLLPLLTFHCKRKHTY
jgi:chromosome segregation ATPase